LKKVFLEYDQKALDAQYEQRTFVPHADRIIARWGPASDAVRSRIGEPRNERYGPAPIETLDVYGEGDKAFVFVHGGAWKRQSKRENAFAAEAFVQAGAAFVVLDFALLPSVTLPEMVAQVRRGIEWVRRSLSADIVLCGHSSGAHLAACALIKGAAVKSALLASGIYDLLPVRLSARNEYVRLDETSEHEYSPIRHSDRIRGVGGTRGRRVLPPVAGVFFSVEAYGQAGGSYGWKRAQSFRTDRIAGRSRLAARPGSA
jgi:arylformamidase